MYPWKTYLRLKIMVAGLSKIDVSWKNTQNLAIVDIKARQS